MRPHHGRVPFQPGHTAAFAEGRYLREQARARRGELRRGHRRPRRRHHPHPVLLAVILVPLTMGAFGTVILAVGLVAFSVAATSALIPFLPLMIIAAASIRSARRVRRRDALRRGGSAGTAPLPARPAAPPRPDLVWGHARRRFEALRMAYAAYECDPMGVLRLPALADVSVPSTARFVDAFAEAQALDTDAFPGGTHGTSYIGAVDRAERAWRAARDAAERIRLSNLTPAERSTVERVIKLLTTARDSDSDPERLAAYARARSELGKLDRAGVVHVPLPARASLDAASRGALPA